MFKKRNESDLLTALNNAVKKAKKEINVDIEKYRDKDGFINLTNVNDFDELKTVIEFVDRKNYLENFDKDLQNLQKVADEIANDFFNNLHIDNVKVKVKTTNGNAVAEIKKDSDKNENHTSDEMNDICCLQFDDYNKDSECEVLCGNYDTISSDSDTGGVLDIEPPSDNYDAISNTSDTCVVLLHNTCNMNNPLFYNAIVHICENEYFSNCGVYTDDEDYPEIVDKHILIPNEWGKIFSETVGKFAKLIDEGKEVFVIDIETFRLTKINKSCDLWDYAMTIIQEKLVKYE